MRFVLHDWLVSGLMLVGFAWLCSFTLGFRVTFAFTHVPICVAWVFMGLLMDLPRGDLVGLYVELIMISFLVLL